MDILVYASAALIEVVQELSDRQEAMRREFAMLAMKPAARGLFSRELL
jgi:hypothetical protein